MYTPQLSQASCCASPRKWCACHSTPAASTRLIVSFFSSWVRHLAYCLSSRLHRRASSTGRGLSNAQVCVAETSPTRLQGSSSERRSRSRLYRPRCGSSCHRICAWSRVSPFARTTRDVRCDQSGVAKLAPGPEIIVTELRSSHHSGGAPAMSASNSSRCLIVSPAAFLSGRAGCTQELSPSRAM